MSVDVDLMTQLARHPVFHALRLPHRDAGRQDAPRRGLVRVGPVDGSEAGERILQPAGDRVPPPDLRPAATVDVEAQDARHLILDPHRLAGSVHISVDSSASGLGQAQPDRLPAGIGQECEVQMTSPASRAIGRRLVPGIDEARALFERVLALRLDLERRGWGVRDDTKRAGRHRDRPLKSSGYASLIRFARGPFWLGSISKLTRSPPARESKFTLESRPVRWKKYSRPSSAAMKPKPRSDTSFLIVPVGI